MNNKLRLYLELEQSFIILIHNHAFNNNQTINETNSIKSYRSSRSQRINVSNPHLSNLNNNLFINPKNTDECG